VGVDLGGLGVGVAHPVLERAEGDAVGGHAGAEGVSELVEGDRADFGSLDGLFESPDEL
jgi:hypothetical protein